jgi:CDP-diacylglycerol--glycerol-3-phosphate 3-phosphatidyltransferase
MSERSFVLRPRRKLDAPSIAPQDALVTLYRIKPWFQARLRPIVRWIAARGGTANQVTLAAAAGSFVVGAILAGLGPRCPWLWLALPPWLLIRMALNAIDGLLAREHGQKSRLGGYLNELCDVGSDAALILPLADQPPFSPGAVVAVTLLASWSELAGVLGIAAGASRRYDGPLGKSDRALLLAGLGAWIGLGSPLPAWAGWALSAAAVLQALTIAVRVSAGLEEGGS